MTINDKKRLIDEVINDVSSSNEQLMSFIFDDNYYGRLDKVQVCKCDVTIESIWTDDDGCIILHIADEQFEGDVKLFSLPDEQIIRVLQSLKSNIE